MLKSTLVRPEVLNLYLSLSKGDIKPETMCRSIISREPCNDNLISAQSRSQLTRSERQIVVGLFLGLSAKEIAIVRESSNRTVEGHVASIKLKMGGERLSGIILSALFEDCLDKGFH